MRNEYEDLGHMLTISTTETIDDRLLFAQYYVIKETQQQSFSLAFV